MNVRVLVALAVAGLITIGCGSKSSKSSKHKASPPKASGGSQLFGSDLRDLSPQKQKTMRDAERMFAAYEQAYKKGIVTSESLNHQLDYYNRRIIQANQKQHAAMIDPASAGFKGEKSRASQGNQRLLGSMIDPTTKTFQIEKSRLDQWVESNRRRHETDRTRMQMEDKAAVAALQHNVQNLARVQKTDQGQFLKEVARAEKQHYEVQQRMSREFARMKEQDDRQWRDFKKQLDQAKKSSQGKK